MKKTLFVVVCLFCTSAAFGQYIGASISSQPQIYEAPSHPAHASYAPIAQETTVISGNNFSYAQGDRPASDFPQAPPVSLGAAARELKKEHAQIKKARIVWENQ